MHAQCMHLQKWQVEKQPKSQHSSFICCACHSALPWASHWSQFPGSAPHLGPVMHCIVVSRDRCCHHANDTAASSAVQVIRHYHGHLSGVYSLALHPTLDLLMTGGRDSVCRVWDMRSKVQAHVLTGHDDTVCSILSQPTDPQVTTSIYHSFNLSTNQPINQLINRSINQSTHQSTNS